jgi:hypothetical protein
MAEWLDSMGGGLFKRKVKFEIRREEPPRWRRGHEEAGGWASRMDTDLHGWAERMSADLHRLAQIFRKTWISP